jgi:hypothetical protein
MNFRDAVATDHLPIARLHAASWRTAYRGALSDEYLARNVMNDRSAVWDERLHRPKDNQIVIVSHSGEALLGFACAFAQRFYQALGADRAGEDAWSAPDGSQIPEFRYAWPAGRLPRRTQRA